MRYFVAPLVAFVVTCVQLRIDLGRSPFGDRRKKALLWWCATAMLDAGVALGVVFGASETGSGSAGNWAGWITIGLLAPLGLRSPFWKGVTIRNRKVDAGITYGYDFARLWLAKRVDDRVTALKTRDGGRRAAAATALGWTPCALLGHYENHLEDLQELELTERQATLERAYLAIGHATDSVRMQALMRVVTKAQHTGVVDHVCNEPPDDAALASSAEACERALDFIDKRERGKL